MLLSKQIPENNDERSNICLLSGGDKLLATFYDIHKSFSNKLGTPRRYVNFLRGYIHIFHTKKKSVEDKQKHLQVCVFGYRRKYGILIYHFSEILIRVNRCS